VSLKTGAVWRFSTIPNGLLRAKYSRRVPCTTSPGGFFEDIPGRNDQSEIEYEDPWDELLRECGYSAVESRSFEHCREWTVESIVGYVFTLSFSPSSLASDELEAFAEVVRERLSELGSEPFHMKRQYRSLVAESDSDFVSRNTLVLIVDTQMRSCLYRCPKEQTGAHCLRQ